MAPLACIIALPTGGVLVRLVGELDIDAVTSLKHLAGASDVSPSVHSHLRSASTSMLDARLVGGR